MFPVAQYTLKKIGTCISMKKYNTNMCDSTLEKGLQKKINNKNKKNK